MEQKKSQDTAPLPPSPSQQTDPLAIPSSPSTVPRTSSISLAVPPPLVGLLEGETVNAVIKRCCRLTKGKEHGELYITNYHFHFKPAKAFHSDFQLPLAVVEKLKLSPIDSKTAKTVPEGNFILEISCKYFRTELLAFESSQPLPQLTSRLNEKLPQSLDRLIAFSSQFSKADKTAVYDAKREFERQGVLNPNSNWRIATINSDYSLCDSYPATLVVPKKAADDLLRKAAAFRSKGRFTVLSYKHHNHASISRCAQPLVGMKQARSLDDELLVTLMRETNPTQRLWIVDARPLTNAVANVALNGAGFEGTNYLCCDLQFLGIPNIHVTRDSHKKLRQACQNHDDAKFWSNVESSQWGEYLRLILSSAVSIVNKIEKDMVSVLCHCSDGWDRTAQLVALAMLMLDPYYRTIQGFEVLIEKEWVSFGHKFAERTGHVTAFDHNERSPIFAQFIECVWLLTQQFPCVFEFNEHFLITILLALYSCRFGTFLGTTEKEALAIRERTESLWNNINSQISLYKNVYYNGYDNSRHDVLVPVVTNARCPLWTNYHLRFSGSYWPEHMYADSSLPWDEATKGAALLNELASLREQNAASKVTKGQPDATDSHPLSL